MEWKRACGGGKGWVRVSLMLPSPLYTSSAPLPFSTSQFRELKANRQWRQMHNGGGSFQPICWWWGPLQSAPWVGQPSPQHLMGSIMAKHYWSPGVGRGKLPLSLFRAHLITKHYQLSGWKAGTWSRDLKADSVGWGACFCFLSCLTKRELSDFMGKLGCGY